MNRAAIAAAAAAAMAGTSSSGCGDETGVPGLPIDFTGAGVYTVPAAPAAEFPIASVRVEQGNGIVTLYYELPADLVGEAQRVALSGRPDAGGTLHLSGKAGTSACGVSPGVLLCHEDLSGVSADPAKASSGLPPGDPRRDAAEAFAFDPIGALRVTIPAGSN